MVFVVKIAAKFGLLRGALWARATKNVKKPQSQMCESCFDTVKQNRNIFDFSQTYDSEVCYCTK